jgi:SNF2 family DNA or RNA helicase
LTTGPVASGQPLDFGSSPEVVRVVAEGERLAFGHLFNPTFAVETALIDPLPHQRIAVYQHLLPQSRLRFLLADDAGAGKTIMAGLYGREMLGRRLVRRILVVAPAGLVGNWDSELKQLFGGGSHQGVPHAHRPVPGQAECVHHGRRRQGAPPGP